MPKGTALVLGGGGVAGIAWTTGLLTGLAGAGADLTGADLIIGTSAGANVAAQVGSGLPLADLYARQADPERQAREIAVELDLERLGAEFVTVMGEAESAQ
ncbi:MAG TPA: patatin-like phospholipase family protein, partial [Streptosporangiaceae bacterium]